ncbi:amidohydrolase family protein [Luteimonas sp. Y-2-2-4F]|nr:amidohydrolase family protein [Luteimonas sp. Y-2-2-4F]MCD9032710.1 amidohydrolase family protein [Luteimonas sp. Y-2-2-4F]
MPLSRRAHRSPSRPAARTARLALALLPWALAACAGAGPRHAGADLYHGFALVDPEAERVVDEAYLLVRDGRIVELGHGAPPADVAPAQRHDMRGTYALPGLFDTHAHITSGPHKVELHDGAPRIGIESVDAITRHHARTALAFGVTTVRNPGGDPVANARYDARIAAGEWIGPEAVHAGAVIQPPPFGGSAFAYPRSEAEWDAEAARQAGLGMRYFKLYTDLSREELAAGVRAARRHGLTPIAHLNAVGWTEAARLGIAGLEHALPTSPDLLEPEAKATYEAGLGPDNRYIHRWFELADFDGPRIREMLRVLAEREVEVSTTLVVNELVANVDDLDRVYPPQDRAYAHPETMDAALTFLQAGRMNEEDHRRARAALPKALELVRRLHAAGIPILIGTDGNGGGPPLARELDLHVQAGIPAWEVLRLATSGAAARLGIGERTGRLAAGMEADIVFLRANPAEDVRRVREVAAVVSDGRMHRFEDLVAPERQEAP